MTDNESWEKTRKTWEKGVNDKLNNMIKNANFTPNTERLVRTATKMIHTSSDGKLQFVNSLSRKTTYTDTNGNKVTRGWADFATQVYKKSKESGSSTMASTKDKYQRAFQDFLKIADKHGDLESSSRGIGSTQDKPSGN